MLTMYEALFGGPPIGAGRATLGLKPAPPHSMPVEEGPIHGPLQPSPGWTTIGAPPVAVQAMVASGSGWKDPSVPLPPSSAGLTVYGPYKYNGRLYAMVIRPEQSTSGNGHYFREWWYEL